LRKSRTGNRFGAFSRIGVMFGAPFRVAVVSSIPVRTLQGVAAALQRDGGPRPVATGTGVLSIASNSSLVHRADSTASATVTTRNESAGSGVSATTRLQRRQQTPCPRVPSTSVKPPTTSPARGAEHRGQRVTARGGRRLKRHAGTITRAPSSGHRSSGHDSNDTRTPRPVGRNGRNGRRWAARSRRREMTRARAEAPRPGSALRARRRLGPR